MASDIHALNIRRAERLVGETLRGKWRLDRLLGVGGMAAVFAATHRNGSRAAVKVLHPGVEEDANTRRRFLREGHAANRVGHSGVPIVLDDDVTDDGRLYLVMELLEGESIDKRIDRRGPLPTDEVLLIIDQVLDVLASAHDKGIVHRDIKPDNFYLTTDGSVKVLDFGIARLHELRGTAATRLGDLMGTLEYMPPEQARGQWDKVDGRSDLWAVGAAAYTMMSGCSVHTADSLERMLAVVSTDSARPLASVFQGVHPKVANLVDRALAFDPAHRWQDARSMQAALRDAYVAVAGYPIEKAPRLPTGVDDAETVTRIHTVAGQAGEQRGAVVNVLAPTTPEIALAPHAARGAPPPEPNAGHGIDAARPTPFDCSGPEGPKLPGEHDSLTKQFVRDAMAQGGAAPSDVSTDAPRYDAPVLADSWDAPVSPHLAPAVVPAGVASPHARPMPPRGTTWMASALSIPKSVTRAVRFFWLATVVVIAMVAAALALLWPGRDRASPNATQASASAAPVKGPAPEDDDASGELAAIPPASERAATTSATAAPAEVVPSPSAANSAKPQFLRSPSLTSQASSDGKSPPSSKTSSAAVPKPAPRLKLR